MRLDREPGKQREFVRIVVGELDPYRQPLDDFHKIAGRILRRQQGERLPRPHRETSDPALEFVLAAVHIDFAHGPLPNPQIGQLRLFEISVDPNLGERPHRHQALALLHVVAWIDVAPRDDAVDLAQHVAIAEIQLGLLQIALRLQELRLGLLDRRRIGDQLRIDFIQIAAGILLVEIGHGFIRRLVPTRWIIAEQGRALDQPFERLAHGGKVLIEIGRNLAQILARRGLGH